MFYENYFLEKSVEKAFFIANFLTKSTLDAILSRRAEKTYPNKTLFQVFPRGNQLGDSILIDLSEAEKSISRLDISRSNFLSILTRKIRIHQWIFDSPRKRALLSIGNFIGIFSWENAKDVVVCHEILKINANTPEEVCHAWIYLNLTYNELYIEKYRTLENAININTSKILEKALNEYNRVFKLYFKNEEIETALKSIDEGHYKVTRATIWANLRQADIKFYSQEYASTVIYLETVLSTIHDFIDFLSAKITENF